MTITEAGKRVQIGDIVRFKPVWTNTNAVYVKDAQMLTGKVVEKYQYHFVVRLKNIKESFTYSDLVTGHVRVIKES